MQCADVFPSGLPKATSEPNARPQRAPFRAVRIGPFPSPSSSSRLLLSAAIMLVMYFGVRMCVCVDVFLCFCVCFCSVSGIPPDTNFRANSGMSRDNSDQIGGVSPLYSVGLGKVVRSPEASPKFYDQIQAIPPYSVQFCLSVS